MPIKVVFWDCDGTLTDVRSSWEYLHRGLGLWDNRADEYQRLFRAGEIDYDEFCRRDALLWAGIPVGRVLEVIAEIPYNQGAREAVETMKQLGILTVIVSTGLSLLTDRVAADLGIDLTFANELTVGNGVLTGEARIKVQYDRKGDVIKRVLEERCWTGDVACAVGDGEGDVGMFQSVVLPIGFHPAEGIVPFVKHSVHGGSLMPVVEIVRNCP
jgi:phosphoserine phosphatase